MGSYLKDLIRRSLFSRQSIHNTCVSDEQLALLLYQENHIKEIEDIIPNEELSYPISHAIAYFLSRCIINMELCNILEFGAGLSSIVFARSLELLGRGRLTSIESDPKWCSDIWIKIDEIKRVDSKLIVSNPRLKVSCKGLYYSYTSARDEIAERGPYDFVFIDAPQWFYGRDGSLHLAYQYLGKHALIVLDDAGRPGDRWSLCRWLQIYPGLELAVFDPGFSKNGVALLNHTGDKRECLSYNCIITSAYHSLLNWNTRRSKK